MKNQVALAVLLSLALLPVARADQASEDRMREQLRQAVMQLRQAQDENADLKAKASAAPVVAAPVVAAPRPDKASKAELEQARAGSRQLQARLSDLQKQLDDANARLTQSQSDLALASQNLHTQVQATHDAEARAAALQETADQVKTCRADNATLVKLSNDLVERYQHRGLAKALWEKEPVTGIPGVPLEKQGQDDHAAVVDATVPPDAAAPQQAQ